MKKAFSLAEVLIAATLMGIFATLTIPSMTKGLIAKRNITAYKNAFAKVKEVVASSPVSDSSEYAAQKIWFELNNALPAIGYTSATTVNGEMDINDGQITDISPASLAERASWCGIKKCVTIGSKSGELAKTEHDYSPWIVTENGYAFTVGRESNANQYLDTHFPDYDCATINNIYHAKENDNYKLGKISAVMSCCRVIVDVNGLNKGPNRLASYDRIEKEELESQVEKADRFIIYIAKDGVSAGPEGLATYWMMNEK